jgi:hypothetical protein
MGTKISVWAALIVLGMMMAPNTEPVYGAAVVSATPPPSEQTIANLTQVEKNKIFMAEWNALPAKIQAMMKESPTF